MNFLLCPLCPLPGNHHNCRLVLKNCLLRNLHNHCTPRRYHSLHSPPDRYILLLHYCTHHPCRRLHCMILGHVTSHVDCPLATKPLSYPNHMNRILHGSGPPRCYIRNYCNSVGTADTTVSAVVGKIHRTSLSWSRFGMKAAAATAASHYHLGTLLPCHCKNLSHHRGFFLRRIHPHGFPDPLHSPLCVHRVRHAFERHQDPLTSASAAVA
ncbi:hypothetical protein NEOLEDRAFT_186612 [Neolentinus lepideus HHB14362 ss-1]|uniref:Uncharacterized protein n=1 Tax=Neolentinus lepideus HHB14362 ss-1 TaxID=1314782 RepID=A0A165TQB7_9AGAM|nr:hypothetical protein NEOLEDRAFT_186612 [Neolentinus lepideus HHB14362 ss-1]